MCDQIIVWVTTCIADTVLVLCDVFECSTTYSDLLYFNLHYIKININIRDSGSAAAGRVGELTSPPALTDGGLSPIKR